MFLKGRLLRDITPEDVQQKKATYPRYSKGSDIEIMPCNELYVYFGEGSCGWIYKNYKAQITNTSLVEGTDYEIIKK